MAKPTLLFLLALLLSRCAEQPLPLPAEPLSESPRLDSTTFLRNAAVAYFNEGAKIHTAYAQMWEAVERGGQKPVGAEYRTRSEACAYFAKAQEINALLPDTLQFWYIRDAAKACPATPPDGGGAGGGVAPAAQDFALRGQMQDAATRGYLPRAAYEQAVITAKGLPPGYLLSRGQFRVDVPGGWSSPITLSVTVPGYIPTIVVVSPRDFGKAIVVPLIAQPKCYEPLRAEGMALLSEKKYQAAGDKFSAAAQCPDVPATNDLQDLVMRAREGPRMEELSKQAEQLALSTQAAKASEEQAKQDDDSDGIPNAADLCPKIKGTSTNRGCPAGDLYRQHTVQDGESLRAIAIQYSMDLQELAVANGMDANDRPMAGKIVLIPVTPVSPSAPGGDGAGGGVAAVLAEIEKNMVAVPGGSFQMGCDEKRDARYAPCEDDEKPLHTVRLSGFSISKYEVTQTQWRAVMGSDPPELYNTGCDDCPVESVSWNEVQDFIKTLNRVTSKAYRLPTEAEWEYAARGGPKSGGFKYTGSNNLDEVAWYHNNFKGGNTFGSQKTTRPVGAKKANELGLYDMSGNVWEWCSDWYDTRFYADNKAASDDPKGPKKGDIRVVRGGSWFNFPDNCQVARRSKLNTAYRYYFCGLRLAR